MASNSRALPLGPFLAYRDSSYFMVPTDEYELSSMPVPTPSRTTGQSASAPVQSDTIPLLDRLRSQDKVQQLPTSKRKSKHKYLQGWHMGVALCAFTAGTVLVINVIVTIWGAARFGVHGTLVTIQNGDCSKSKKLSLWLHLAINILSTLLLGASNYCMQCLSSPSRAEIDSAHSQHIWLDIGVPSVRNLRRVSWNKIILWWLFAISTIPLHLLYNSAIFSTIGANDYEVSVGPENLVTGVGLNWSLPLDDGSNRTLHYFQQAANWDNLTNEECLKVYTQVFVTGNNNVLAVTSALNDSSTVLNSGYPLWQEIPSNMSGGFGWVCDKPHPCDEKTLVAEAANWTIAISDWKSVRTIPIQYCLSQPVEGYCTLQFSLLIITIVIVCNLTKWACMMMLLLRQQAKPLVTLGDAVDSFLETPDPTTENMCLADKRKFSAKRLWLATCDLYEPKQLRWFAGASWKRWLTCNILSVSTLIAAGMLLSQGLQGLNNNLLNSRSITDLWSLGFGAVNADSLVGISVGSGITGLHLSILIANSPQVLLSFLFLTYNGLFTCMLMGHEWSGYAHVRKPLRVTSPAGSQRSTYRLQLPYKYGIPLLVLSGTLHWLVSQSIFLARIEWYSDGVLEPYFKLSNQTEISNLGYSCIAIITVIGLGSIVILIGILHGFRRYKPGVPLAGSCSAAISAACHRPNEDVDAAYKPVMWGAVESKNPIGHCCFTSFEVTKPVKGQVYA
ncbi:hypothetical protein JMJ35_002655 [Cladonia borealis]|uniref:DUF6536 domain-containing protein n=1 Tax=Cladonia borealis TaxID=184061 RepID=A0AA39UD92_9LECA|nr:hypothetical protein JMJ35_002655 [Cladonia borealis]